MSHFGQLLIVIRVKGVQDNYNIMFQRLQPSPDQFFFDDNILYLITLFILPPAGITTGAFWLFGLPVLPDARGFHPVRFLTIMGSIGLGR